MSCKTGQIHHTAQPHVWQGSPGRVWVLIIPSLAQAAQARAPLCPVQSRQGRNWKLSSPSRQICFVTLSYFLFNNTFLSPPLEDFHSWPAVSMSPLQVSPVVPSFTPVALPQIIPTHFTKKNPTKSASPLHPSLLIWSSASALAGTGSGEATPGTCGLEQVTRCLSQGARAFGGLLETRASAPHWLPSKNPQGWAANPNESKSGSENTCKYLYLWGTSCACVFRCA